eukprot:877049-Pleurochrysis_carterae.AAC.6
MENLTTCSKYRISAKSGGPQIGQVAAQSMDTPDIAKRDDANEKAATQRTGSTVSASSGSRAACGGGAM